MIENELKKLECKLKRFEDMEDLVEKEREQLDQQRIALFAEMAKAKAPVVATTKIEAKV